RIASSTASGSGLPSFSSMTSVPASWTSQSKSTPVASSTRRVASASSGPVPSPGMSITRCAKPPRMLPSRRGTTALGFADGRCRGPFIRSSARVTFRSVAPKKSVQLSGVSVAETSISSIDAERGVLMYRGYDIADLAEHATYEEVAYLLLEGELPTGDQLAAFKEELGARELPRATASLIDDNADEAAPMEMLRTAVSTLSFGDPDEAAIDRGAERRKAASLIAQLPAIVARYDRRRRGLEPVDPDHSLSYAENFLTMLRGEAP